MKKFFTGLLFGLIWLIAGAAAHAQVDVEAATASVQALERELQGLTRNLGDVRDDDDRLVALSERVRALSGRAVEVGVELSPELVDIRLRLDQIGVESQAAEEPAFLVQERELLSAERALINALIGRLEMVTIDAGRLREAISEARRDLFTNRLARRYNLNAAFGPELFGDVQDRAATIVRRVTSWSGFAWRFKAQQMAAATALSFAAALIFAIFGRRALGIVVRRDPQADSPSYVARLTTAFMTTLFPAVTLLLFLTLVLAFYLFFDVLRGDIGQLLGTVFAAIWVVFLVWRLVEAIFAPGLPAWRLVPVTDRAASLLKWLIVAMAIVTVGDRVIGEAIAGAGGSLSITVAKTLFSSLLVAFILAAIALVRPFPGGEGEHDRRWPMGFRILMFALVAVLVVSSALGYIGFAGFLSEQIVASGAIAATMYLGYRAAHAISREHALAGTRLGGWLRERLELSEARIDQLGLVAGVLLVLAVFCIGVPLLLIFWGFSWIDIRGWLFGAMNEFAVGSISISITGILTGILVFAIGYWLTKLVQRWLDSEVLSRGHMDTGLRNSIRTGAGYAGITIAVMIGVSVAGIDLSQLALIAGALSLGIGFGLQNIVSNFVSGLILLAERPFKVGDWIEAGGVSGYVKSINVRATEIETFQRKTVILPNSDLINGAVANWTHRNTLGRVEVPVGVSYSSDPGQVREILLDIAGKHPLLLMNPEPYVLFADFGDSSLDFELRGFLADINDILTVSTDLRFEIFERFRQAGIEIPFPQRDVHMRLVDTNDAVVKDLGSAPATGPASYPIADGDNGPDGD
ncbi:mechanosensitive ion channel family protein [Oricola sp.]|uniref:mechanosensitive ion channel family protein n=1 Tax=Oricola sp. TaxID=1979950 RepID=UPI003BAD3BF8